MKPSETVIIRTKQIDFWQNKIKKLQEQLKIATKALKEYADKDKWEHCSPDWRDAEEALKEMEGVK